MPTSRFTPQYLAALRVSSSETLINDVQEQIDEANKNGLTETRVYFEGDGDFSVVYNHFTNLGFKLTAPSASDTAKFNNISYWCDWTLDTEGKR